MTRAKKKKYDDNINDYNSEDDSEEEKYDDN